MTLSGPVFCHVCEPWQAPPPETSQLFPLSLAKCSMQGLLLINGRLIHLHAFFLKFLFSNWILVSQALLEDATVWPQCSLSSRSEWFALWHSNRSCAEDREMINSCLKLTLTLPASKLDSVCGWQLTVYNRTTYLQLRHLLSVSIFQITNKVKRLNYWCWKKQQYV